MSRSADNADIRSITCCGRKISSSFLYVSGCSSFHLAISASQVSCLSGLSLVTFFSCSRREEMIFLALPTIGILASTFFDISAGSISPWITLTPGQNSFNLPVTRSSKRTPRAMMRSVSVMARLAYQVPCIPGMPRLSGWFPGIVLIPIRVVVTGISPYSARARNSSAASAAMIPPPQYIMGRFASAMALAAALTCLGWPLTVGL